MNQTIARKMRTNTILLSILSSALLLASCEMAVPVEVTPAGDDVTGSMPESACIPGVVRLKVSESMAEKLIGAEGEDGIISAESLPTEMSGAGFLSMRPCFNIGGPYERLQRESGLHLWFEARIESEIPATKSAASLPNDLPFVESAEPVYRLKEQSVSMNDPYYTQYQWHYWNTGQFGFRSGMDMGLQRAWDKYGIFGNENVIVAVIDSGVDCMHPDLQPNIWVNQGEIAGNGRDDDGNGFVDDVNGFNFVTDNAKINPVDHGTHVAGTVAAVNNNGIGVCGVAGGRMPDVPGVKMMSLQVIDPNYPNMGADIQKAFQYAAENGALIAQNSWGYEESQHVVTLPPSVKAGIDYFINVAGLAPDGSQKGLMKGGLVIFAAGNDAVDMAYPAAYEKVVSVAAIGPYGAVAYYSNYGDWVDVCAPGGDQTYNNGGVYSTLPDSKYGGFQGTSMACPHVSGIAALVLSAAGGEGYTCNDLKETLLRGTDPSIYQFNPSMQGKLGVGMVDAELALSTLNLEPPQPVTEFSVRTRSNTIVYEAVVPSDDGGASKARYMNVYYSRNQFTAASKSRAIKVQFDVNELEEVSPGKVRFTVRALEFNAGYYCAVSASDFARNESSLSPVDFVTTGSNTAPSVVCDVKNLTVKAWEDVDVTFRAVDPDGHSVTLFLEGNQSSLSFSYDDQAQQGVLTIHAASAPEGLNSCIIRAMDEYGAMGQTTFSFTVLPNNPPVITREIASVAVNGPGDEVVLKAGDYFSDPDGEPLFVTPVIADRRVLEISFSDGNIIFRGLRTGSTAVRLVVSDSRGESVTAEFGVVVRDPSRPVDVYPNPVVDFVNVRTGQPFKGSVRILSATGSEVYSAGDVSISLNEPLRMDMRSAAPGNYTVVLKSAGGEYKSSFSKK